MDSNYKIKKYLENRMSNTHKFNPIIHLQTISDKAIWLLNIFTLSGTKQNLQSLLCLWWKFSHQLMNITDDDDDSDKWRHFTQQDTGRLSGGVTFSRWIGVCNQGKHSKIYFKRTHSNVKEAKDIPTIVNIFSRRIFCLVCHFCILSTQI
jgi:hypothetical protein